MSCVLRNDKAEHFCIVTFEILFAQTNLHMSSKNDENMIVKHWKSSFVQKGKYYFQKEVSCRAFCTFFLL